MDTEKTLSLADFFDFLWRGLPLALALAGLLGFGAYIIRRQAPPTYTARATVTLLEQTPESPYRGPIYSEPLKLSDYRTAAENPAILLDALGLESSSSEALASASSLGGRLNVRAQNPSTSNFLFVEVSSDSPGEAAEFSNAVAEALIAWDQARANTNIAQAARVTEEQLEQLRAELGADASGELIIEKRTQLLELRAAQGQGQSNLELIQAATPPRDPSSVATSLIVGVAALLGLFVGYALFLTRSVVTRRVLKARDLASATGLNVLADVPGPFPGPSQAAAPRLASYVRAQLATAGDGVYLVTGNHDNAGQEQLGLALASSFLRSGKRSLWISTDPQRPSAAWEAQVRMTPRYTPLELLLEQPQIKPEPLSLALSAHSRLDVLYGLEDGGALEDQLSSGLPGLVSTLRANYDRIVISSPSPLSSANALTVAPFCEGALLSCDIKHATQKDLLELTTLLRGTGVPVLGAVVTRASKRRSTPNTARREPQARANAAQL